MKQKALICSVFIIATISVIYAQKRELITKEINFDLQEIELKDTLFIKKLNDLMIDMGDTLIDSNKQNIFSLFISKQTDKKYFITIDEISKITPCPNDIGFYTVNGNTFKIEGEIIEDIFCVTKNKKQFRAKIVVGTKYKGKILPYVESYIDREWIFVYECGKLSSF